MIHANFIIPLAINSRLIARLASRFAACAEQTTVGRTQGADNIVRQETAMAPKRLGLLISIVCGLAIAVIVTIKAAGADIFFNEASPKFAAQAIKKAAEIGWKPVQLLASISNSVGSVLRPAGLESAKGILSTNYLKDATEELFGPVIGGEIGSGASSQRRRRAPSATATSCEQRAEGFNFAAGNRRAQQNSGRR
jgi:hypothetical protein